MMSETPRLTRRQLREMGKLQTRPNDAPSLSETQELRLRRPSRKEMREAERREREQLEKLDMAAKEEENLPSVQETSAGQTGSEPSLRTPSRVSVFDRFSEDGRGGSEEESSVSQQKAKPAGRETDRAQSTPAPDSHTNAAQEPEPGAGEYTGGNAAHGESDVCPGREQEDNSLRSRLLQRMQGDTVSDNEPAAARDAGADASGGQEEAAPRPGAEEDAEEEKSAEECAGVSEVEVRADYGQKHSWLLFLVLIVVGAIIGYLLGSWINAAFFSAGDPTLPAAVSGVRLL